MKTARRAVTEFGEYVCSGCAELTQEIPRALLSDTSHTTKVAESGGHDHASSAQTSLVPSPLPHVSNPTLAGLQG